MSQTKIDWATDVWNPVTGCSKVSPGCKNCYAERMAARLKAMGQPRYADGFAVRCHHEALDEPLHWRKPRRVFVCSMGDLFHEDVPEAFIRRVWAVMEDAQRHTFHVLTKRPERMRSLLTGAWPMLPNAWIGLTVEDQQRADERLSILPYIPAAVRFVSVEPMLGPVDLRLLDRVDVRVGLPRGSRPGYVRDFIGWVICGCESGPGARPMSLDWARALRDQCQAAGVPFFLKQMRDPVSGRIIKMPSLDGRVWGQIPAGAGGA